MPPTARPRKVGAGALGPVLPRFAAESASGGALPAVGVPGTDGAITREPPAEAGERIR
ncbi:hypothetical protein NWFMUON74_45030 [Nocardia wallacei]|uniref:Uncharacterized protein n=1 Tax=Nocardia wallacei TaxID=480035 RepID=A0A7G1KPG7_9NOCA|nr:hypothetical protein NWFMUON74_45030 [Nocardia wallacei]